MFPIFGFLLSSFRPGESIKRTSWWDAVYTGTIWSELSFNNYQEVFRAENLDRSFYNSLAVTIPSTIWYESIRSPLLGKACIAISILFELSS